MIIKVKKAFAQINKHTEIKHGNTLTVTVSERISFFTISRFCIFIYVPKQHWVNLGQLVSDIWYFVDTNMFSSVHKL